MSVPRGYSLQPLLSKAQRTTHRLSKRQKHVGRCNINQPPIEDVFALSTVLGTLSLFLASLWPGPAS